MIRLLFRLNPVLYWLAGLLIMVGAGLLYFDTIERNQIRAQALAEGPPEATPLQDFDRARHVNAAKETAVLAGINFDLAYERRDEGSSRVDDTFAPLTTTDGSGDPTEVRAVLLELSGALPPDAVASWATTDARGAPAFRIHGEIATPLMGLKDDIEEQFAKDGLRLAEEVVFIDPFLKPREEELKPRDEMAIGAVTGGIGLLVFLYGFLRRWMKGRA